MLFMKRKDHREQSEARNHVLVERIERLMKKMPERDDDEHDPQRQERLSGSPTNQQKAAGDQLHERDEGSHEPERPDWKEGVGIWEKPAPRVFERALLKNLEYARHEEDQRQDQARKESHPRQAGDWTGNPH